MADRTWEETIMTEEQMAKTIFAPFEGKYFARDEKFINIYGRDFFKVAGKQAHLTGDIAYKKGWEGGMIQGIKEAHADIKRMGITGISAMEDAVKQARKIGIKEVVDKISSILLNSSDTMGRKLIKITAVLAEYKQGGS